jgi:hypothetical protein
MPELSYFTKDPEAQLDYPWDWTAWLDGDTIVSHDVTADTGITVESSAIVGGAVVVWLSGGTANETYSVKVTIDTAGGRTDERTSKFRIRNR